VDFNRDGSLDFVFAGVLQCVAVVVVYCGVLQRVAEYGSVL